MSGFLYFPFKTKPKETASTNAHAHTHTHTHGNLDQKQRYVAGTRARDPSLSCFFGETRTVVGSGCHVLGKRDKRVVHPLEFRFPLIKVANLEAHARISELRLGNNFGAKGSSIQTRAPPLRFSGSISYGSLYPPFRWF